MANDVTAKSTSNSNNNDSESTSLPAADQQKVPPLRIVLNTASNQKTSTSSAVALNDNKQSSNKGDKSQDGKTEGTLKTGGRVRIKLGTNKQQLSKTSSVANETVAPTKASSDSGARSTKSTSTNEKQGEETTKEETASHCSHLRRITRRSRRAIQSVSNEDEESKSSMTSTDENQVTNNTNNSDTIVPDPEPTSTASTPSTATTTTSTSTNATNGSTNNADTPRRYKRRRGETSESQSYDTDNLFGFQSYKLPVQNSFELFKNIRKQVDKKLKNLTSVHPRAPHGFREYMLARGAYLLDGNKLGNGTNLYKSEDGGLHSVPIGKYHALKHNRIKYSVPDRTKVPLGLPVNSPLYDLFIEQEKERYRMQMQHIKEREKLTLAVEQEMVRVYNQAALAATDQVEPFSVCTMLKHQEIYNYLDSDGLTILSREDAQQDQTKPDRARTRRRQHEHISPPPSRKNSANEESIMIDAEKKDNKSPEAASAIEKGGESKDPVVHPDDATNSGLGTTAKEQEGNSGENSCEDVTVKMEIEVEEKSTDSKKSETEPSPTELSETIKSSEAVQGGDDSQETKGKSQKQSNGEVSTEADAASDEESTGVTPDESAEKSSGSKILEVDNDKETDTKAEQVKKDDEANSGSSASNGDPSSSRDAKADSGASIEQDSDSQNDPSLKDVGLNLTEEDRQSQNKEIFLAQLQMIDDKWDKTRNEMMIRHKNEAESLHAIQRLEWEWKTKEIGACDVRMTPVIDGTLVPRLNIYSQDY